MPRLRLLCASVIVATCVITLPRVFAQNPEAAKPPQQPSGPPSVDAFKALKYRSIGPAQGGRVSRVAGVPGDPSTYYAATASGGVWKSVDGGLTWKPVFDDQPTSSIGSITVSPSHPNIVYVGSGEANIRGNVSAGNGIYRSVDGGRTWTAAHGRWSTAICGRTSTAMCGVRQGPHGRCHHTVRRRVDGSMSK
jgi:hypothetical protein